VACLGQSGFREGIRTSGDTALKILVGMVVAFTIACLLGASTMSGPVVITPSYLSKIFRLFLVDPSVIEVEPAIQ
jgi:hypothetical protein